ncbi:hypothetical protein KAW80_03805 [Candidatus Babeliales bacterium]|nr:hypothetical protein [Candidatus Babeliales bacterium]
MIKKLFLIALMIIPNFITPVPRKKIHICESPCKKSKKFTAGLWLNISSRTLCDLQEAIASFEGNEEQLNKIETVLQKIHTLMGFSKLMQIKVLISAQDCEDPYAVVERVEDVIGCLITQR